MVRHKEQNIYLHKKFLLKSFCVMHFHYSSWQQLVKSMFVYIKPIFNEVVFPTDRVLTTMFFSGLLFQSTLSKI